jgi:hypothetical protein
MNPYITTKKQKPKNKNNHSWIWVMVIIIFLILFSTHLFSQEYRSFYFIDDPQWQYIDYLPYKASINIGIIDNGPLKYDQDYDLLGEYASGTSFDYETHGSHVISIIKSPKITAELAINDSYKVV